MWRVTKFRKNVRTKILHTFSFVSIFLFFFTLIAVVVAVAVVVFILPSWHQNSFFFEQRKKHVITITCSISIFGLGNEIKLDFYCLFYLIVVVVINAQRQMEMASVFFCIYDCRRMDGWVSELSIIRRKTSQ